MGLNEILKVKYKVTSFIVHELELKKKWVFGDERTKPDLDFLQPQDVYFLKKFDELPELVVFGQKLSELFYRPESAKRGPRKN